MSISSRINTIEEHIGDIYDTLELAGSDLTNVNKNIVNINSELKNNLKYYLANGTDTLWNNWEKVTGSGTEVTLNNTLKGKMNVGVSGNTKQATAILPDTYQQVDYIQSSGTQYIDTGIVGKDTIKYQYKFLQTEYNGNVTLGTMGTGSNNTSRMFITNSKLYLDIYGESSRISQTFENLINTVHNWEIGNRYVKDIDTNTILISNTSLSSFSTTTNITICGTQTSSKQKIYGLKIYDNETIIRDFIPCYRKSDNVVGLYDLVNNVFYTNAGTGAFTYGSTASLPNPDFPIPVENVSGEVEVKVENKNIVKLSADNDTVTFGSGSTIDFTNTGCTITTTNQFRGDYFAFNVETGSKIVLPEGERLLRSG